MTLKQIAVCAALFAALVGPAAGSPLEGAGAALSDPAGALTDYQAKEKDADDVWDRMPMVARRVLLVQDVVKAYGAYDERASNEYKDTEKVISYIEPAGFVFKDVGGGILSYGFKVGVKVTKEDGSTIFEKPDYALLDSKTRSRKREVEFDSALGIKGLAAGAYTIEFLFHDLNGDKTMSVKQVFKVVG